MDELKRCPFCGEKAVIRTFPGKVFNCYKVYCSNICYYICSVTRIYHDKKEAIEAWNRRADDGTFQMISAPTENERTVTGMDEYIEREALRKAFDNADADVVEEYEDGTCDWGFGHQNILEVINSVPAADVAQVRWQPVFGYEGLYEVNQFGQIRNKDGQIMRQRLKKAKYTVYKKVSLYKNGKYKHLYVHRIVAQAFIPNPKGFDLINHKDEDGTNNVVDNLEWCDRSYNATYGTSPKKISKAFNGIKSEKRIAVYAVNKSGDFAGEWDSITEAAKNVGCSTSEISGALKGKRKTVKGLIWNYRPNCDEKMDGDHDG